MDRSSIQQQLDAFAEAPALYLASAVTIAVVVWALCKIYYSGQVTTLRERLSLAEDQRDEFKNKLSVSSPDEARAKVDKLEGELAGMNRIIAVTVGYHWTQRTDTEVNELAGKLSSIPKHRVLIMYGTELGRELAQSLYRAFQKAGWEGATFSDGSGAHLGIIAGPGASRAGLIKQAIEATTRYKIDLDKPTNSDSGNVIYLFVGTNPDRF